MNKNTIIKGVMLILLIVLACLLIYKKFLKKEKEVEEPKEFILEITSIEEDALNKIYDNVYTYKVDVKAKMIKEDITNTLEGALNSDLLNTNDILSKMKLSDSVYTPTTLKKIGDIVITKCENDNLIISDKEHKELCESIN